MIIRFIFLVIFYCLSTLLLSQNLNKTIDSLYKVLKTAKEDTNKVNILNELGWPLLTSGELDNAKRYTDSALILAKKLNFKLGEGKAYNMLGMINNEQGNNIEAMEFYSKSLTIAKELDDKIRIATIYNNIGFLKDQEGNYPDAMKNHLASLKISEEIGDKDGISTSYLNIGRIYHFQDNYSDALKNYQTALMIQKEIGNKHGMANSYNNIGLIHEIQGNYPEALKNYLTSLRVCEEMGYKRGMAFAFHNMGNLYSNQKNNREALNNYLASLKILQEIGDKGSMAASYSNIGSIYLEQANYPEALENFLTSLKIHKEVGNKVGISHCYFQVGKMYINKRNYAEAMKNYLKSLEISEEIGNKDAVAKVYVEIGNLLAIQATFENNLEAKLKQDKAIIYLDKGLSIATEIGNNATIKYAYESLAATYQEKNDFQKALEYYYLFVELKDSLLNNETTQKLEQLRTQYEVEKAVADEKTQQELEKSERKRKNEILLIGLVMLGIISLFIILFLRQRNQKRSAVEKAATVHKMAELELQSLRAQLNPHFMFNSLNAIQELILLEENDKSHTYLARFAKLLRMLLENANSPFIPLARELEFLELYLSLENLRIPDLQYSIYKDPTIDAEQIKIPNMILQPYIENALWHGLSHKKIGDRKIQLRVLQMADGVNYEIEDNGVGRKKATELKSLYRKEHRSKGMELLTKRFKLLSEEYRFEIKTCVIDLMNEEEVVGTLVTIKVPWELSKELKRTAS